MASTIIHNFDGRPKQTFDLRAAAQAYADAMRREGIGAGIIPCHSVDAAGACSCGSPDCRTPGKHPITAAVPHGAADASLDAGQVDAWWHAWPSANVGIVCGAGLGAFDIDTTRGGVEWWQANAGELPPTWAHDTPSGGGHVFFAVPAQDAGLARGAVLFDGGKAGCRSVEWRGAGAYVIAPPSTHLAGVYTARGDTPGGRLAALPDSLAALIRARTMADTAAEVAAIETARGAGLATTGQPLPRASSPAARPLPRWARDTLAEGAAGAARHGIAIPCNDAGEPDASNMAARLLFAMAAHYWPASAIVAAFDDLANAGAAKVHKIADRKGQHAADRWLAREYAKAAGYVNARRPNADQAAARRGTASPVAAFLADWRPAILAQDWQAFGIQAGKAAAVVDGVSILARRAGVVDGLALAEREAVLASGVSRMTVRRVLAAIVGAGGAARLTPGGGRVAACYRLTMPATTRATTGDSANLVRNSPYPHACAVDGKAVTGYGLNATRLDNVTGTGSEITESAAEAARQVMPMLESVPPYVDAWRRQAPGRRPKPCRRPSTPLPDALDVGPSSRKRVTLTGDARLVLAKLGAWREAMADAPEPDADRVTVRRLAELTPVQPPRTVYGVLRRLAAYGLAVPDGRDDARGAPTLWRLAVDLVDLDALAADVGTVGRADVAALRIADEREAWRRVLDAAEAKAGAVVDQAEAEAADALQDTPPARTNADAVPLSPWPAPPARPPDDAVPLLLRPDADQRAPLEAPGVADTQRQGAI